eukprot:jgi/Psemu1/317629/estExt_fgenesh1_pm.C_210005
MLLTLVEAVAAFSPKLLDARRVPLSALTAPGNFYFLEFPVNENDSKLNPICADGTPYSFAFRRGSDEHVSKFVIEFEGGPACWDDGVNSSCCSSAGANGRRQVPWRDYMTFFRDQVVFHKTLPELGTCKGLSTGFVSEGAGFILSDSNGIRGFVDDDIPLVLRRDEGWWDSLGGEGSDLKDWSYILLPHCTMDWHLGHKKFPQLITGCTDNPMDVDGVYHRGGTNVDAVVNWIQKQFPSGLDALVTTAGGRLGGCTNDLGPAVTSSIAPALLAANLVKSKTDEKTSPPPPALPSTLVVLEGSSLWDSDLPTPEVMAERWNADLPSGGSLSEAIDDLVESSTKETQFIWMTSNEGTASEEEELWFMKHANNHRDKFHVFEPTARELELDGNKTALELDGNKTKLEWCPLYTFPDSDVGVAEFFADVVKSMSWYSESSSASASASASSSTSNTILKTSLSASAVSGAAKDSRTRLSFFSIFVMVGAIFSLAWIVYYIRKHKNAQNGKNAPLSPTDLWFIALTRYPVAFLVVSVTVPIVLSSIGFAHSQIKVNMDFDSYLQVDTDLENVKRNFEKAQQNQEASLEIEQANCNLYGNSIFGNRKLSDDVDTDADTGYGFDPRGTSADDSMFGNHKLLQDLGVDVEIDQKIQHHALSDHHRDLSYANLNYFSGGEWVSIMYENRKGGNVFEPDVLKAIHEFESSIYGFPGFDEYCYGLDRCFPIDSLVSRFFTNGQLVGNIDAVLRSFLTDRPALWKLDQYFGPDNLGSNVTRSFVFLKNVGGDQSATHPFLRSFHRDFLAKHYRKKTYPEFVHTWNNFIMKTTEADDALLHDSLWAIASLFFVSFMILFKVQSVFVVFFSMLGMVLAFSVSYYWLSVHFFVKDITLIWVAGLFVMLGIAADDIFLMVDSFDHTKYDFEETESARFTDVNSGDSDLDDQEKTDAKIDILRERIKVAYAKAGSMMLVSSVTTSICFFSNGFGVLTVIQEFGIFMGARYLLFSTIFLALILGICGALTFAVNDGSIVLYSNKYNLGRLEKVIDSYYSDGEDVYTTIEESAPATFAPVTAPTPVPAPTPTGPPVSKGPTIVAKIVWKTPEEAAAEGLPGAISPEKLEDMIGPDADEDIFGPDAQAPSAAPDSDTAPQPVTDPGTQAPQAVVVSTQAPQAASSLNQGASNIVTSSITSTNSGSTNIGSGSTNIGSGSGSKLGSSSSSNQASYYEGDVASSILKPNMNMRRRETIHVKLIWGVDSGGDDSSLWLTNKVQKSSQSENGALSSSSLDLADPRTQEWLLKVVEMAKSKPHLFVRQDKLTWIERLRDFAAYAGVQFPIPKHLFTTYVELLKFKDGEFDDVIDKGIGTSAPGLAGDFTFASLTMMVDAVEVGNAAQAGGRVMSEDIYRDWTEFAAEANKLSPPEVPPVVAQSGIFLDAYRVEAMYESTLTTWFVANGLCLLVILVFIQNLALSFMVMVTITLILLCLGGFLFAIYRIPFGPVEALGVSIFIGLSANYSLHVVHAYHHSKSKDRDEKIKEAIFAVGSPIVASALSTMGASAFLFACRTWVFIELGILICSITGMALLYTMTFLFSWLSIAGPLPIEQRGHSNAHRWDLKVMCWDACQKDKGAPEQGGDDGKDPDEDNIPVEEKPDTEHAGAAVNDDESVYSIEIVGDAEDAEEAEEDLEDPATDTNGPTKETSEDKSNDEANDEANEDGQSTGGTEKESEWKNSK